MLRKGSRRLQVQAAARSVFAIAGLVVLSTAPETSQRISRSPAKNSMFESFHYWAGLPRPSDFARKRKIAANSPCGKRRSRGVVDTELKTVKHEKRVKKKITRTSRSPSPTLNFFAVAYGHNGHFLQHNWYISWELLKSIIGGKKA